MQRSIFVLALWCAFNATTLLAQEKFPYVGYIQGNDIPIRSGPGSQYYATDQLEEGTKVEVYRHVSGGWCAIRPTMKSYNWIPASNLQMTDEEGVAEIVGQGVVALVGTNIESPKQYRWQIRLDRGELIDVLGVKQNLNLDGTTPQSWCKIAPPAGEFRWIESRRIARKTPLGKTAAPIAQIPLRKIPSSPTDPPESVESSTAFRDITDQVVARSKNPSARNENSPFGDKLKQINLDLSAVLAKNSTSQQFADLLSRTEILLEEGKTPLERGRARLLLSKIDQFERLQQSRIQRGDTLPSAITRFDNSALTHGALTQGAITQGAMSQPNILLAPDATAIADSGVDPRFDGSGWLRPMRTRNRTGPPYALVSRDNRILKYVTPAPGINLHRYLGRQIGIHGQSRYISQLQRPHLTAQHVKVLDRKLR